MDSKVEERWACWACQIPMDKDYPQKTGKVTFCPAKEQCYHWWQRHASQGCWDLISEFEKYNISHSEMMTALGIDLKEFPLPVGTALTRIPAILPSHEAGHDPRIADEQWKRKIAWSSHSSERSVPWAWQKPFWTASDSTCQMGASVQDLDYYMAISVVQISLYLLSLGRFTYMLVCQFTIEFSCVFT